MECDWRVILNSYLQAYNFRPSRLEPVYHIAFFYRSHQQYALGYHFARLVTEVPYPDDVMFIERDVYELQLPLEYILCCEGTGRFWEAIEMIDKLLSSLELAESSRAALIQSRCGILLRAQAT